MWSPTHVQVLVKRAKGIILKGKNSTNDAFVIIALGKEKYQTSVKKKSSENPEWCEMCELQIPSQGNTAEILLTVLHQNFLGVDEFLGMVALPLRDFDVHERPRSRWYHLKCKPGQSKAEYRGELEVQVVFTVQSIVGNNATGSTMDLKQKDKRGSLQSLNKAASSFGGSLLSLGTKEKRHLKKLANKVTAKVEKANERAKKSLAKSNIKEHPSEDSLSNKFDFEDDPRDSSFSLGFSNRDPGVNSDEEDDYERQSEVNDLIPEEEDIFKFDNGKGSVKGSGGGGGGLNGSFESIQEEGSLRRSGSGASYNERRQKAATLGRLSQRDVFPSVGGGAAIEEEEESPVLDEWEAKLLGKKGTVSSTKKDDYIDTISLSQLSQSSQNSGFLDKPRSLLTTPITNKKLSSSPKPLDTPSGRKKILPVPSEFDSATSPDSPSSPESASFPKEEADKEGKDDKKKKSGLQKLKSGYRSLVDSGKTGGSLFNLSHVTSTPNKGDSFSGDKRNTSEAPPRSSGTLPPSGTRIVLGQETTPPPASHGPSSLSREALDRYSGKSREELIQMVMELQSSMESQARKQSDLEEYIDSLVIKVIAKAPSLLQKEPDAFLKSSGLALKTGGIK